MKKILVLVSILLFISSCSTSYVKYDYNQYFQNNEPYVTVDSQEEAASFIARKLARGFRRSPQKTIVVLNFTDEYGDKLNRGVFFADMIVSGLSYYRNPVVVERESLYEIVKERELTQSNLIENRGITITSLVQADYILSGRILRGRNDDMISVRCFEVGTGKVVYASTISIDYTPDPIPVPVPVPVPQGPHHPHPHPPVPVPDPGPTTPPITTTDPEPETPTGNGIENGGKIDLGNTKDTNSDQYQKKTKPTTTTTAKKPASSEIKNADVKMVVPNRKTVEKSVPVNKEMIKGSEPVKEKVSKKTVSEKEKETVSEEKVEKTAKSPSSKTKKSISVKK